MSDRGECDEDLVIRSEEQIEEGYEGTEDGGGEDGGEVMGEGDMVGWTQVAEDGVDPQLQDQGSQDQRQ